MRRRVRSDRLQPNVTATTTSVATPPSTTDGTVTNSFAVTPDSNIPISFEEPTKTLFTDDTRPNRCRGVSVCSRFERIDTLTMSAAPASTSIVTDSQNDVDRPNPMVNTPN